MKFSIGMHDPSRVEITNKQGFVEVDVLWGSTNEQEVRRSIGNCGRGCYDEPFSGHYSDRKKAIARMEDKIKMLKDEMEKLEFAVRVTKKKDWRFK